MYNPTRITTFDQYQDALANIGIQKTPEEYFKSMYIVEQHGNKTMIVETPKGEQQFYKIQAGALQKIVEQQFIESVSKNANITGFEVIV